MRSRVARLKIAIEHDGGNVGGHSQMVTVRQLLDGPLSFSGHFGSPANRRATLRSVDFAPNADVRVLYLFRSVSYFVLRLRLLADGATNFRDMPTLMRLRPRRERFHRLNLAGRHAHERLFSGNGDMARLTTNRADQE